MNLLWAQQGQMVGTFVGGVRGGVTTSKISGDNLDGFHKIGAVVGGFAYCQLLDQPKFGLKLQMEMNFVMKGSRSYTPPKQVVNPLGKYVLNLGYVEVPVLARMRFARITIRNSSDFEVEVGPAFGVNIYHQERDAYGIIQGRPDFSRFELSMMGGLTYLFKEHHSISARYSNSVLAVRIPNWNVNHWVYKQYNSLFYITYGYQF